MTTDSAELTRLMKRAVRACTAHVDAGGLPFVGVVATPEGEAVSGFAPNRVAETADPMAHAEIVAMREVLADGRDDLTGLVLLATGEACGQCYRYAIDHGIDRIYVAVDRDRAAALGFDYRSSYRRFGVTDAIRDRLARSLSVPDDLEPFTRYIDMAGAPPEDKPS